MDVSQEIGGGHFLSETEGGFDIEVVLFEGGGHFWGIFWGLSMHPPPFLQPGCRCNSIAKNPPPYLQFDCTFLLFVFDIVLLY